MKTFRNDVLDGIQVERKQTKNTTTSFYEKTVVVFFLFSKKSIFCIQDMLELTPRPHKKAIFGQKTAFLEPITRENTQRYLQTRLATNSKLGATPQPHPSISDPSNS